MHQFELGGEGEEEEKGKGKKRVKKTLSTVVCGCTGCVCELKFCWFK